MALHAGWPAVSGAATFLNIRQDVAGDVARDATGAIRQGIYPAHTNAIVAATGTMNVSVGAFVAAISRNGLVRVANDGAVNVLISNAPGAGSRWSIVYVKQRESAAPMSDGADGPVLDKVESTTSEATARGLLPAGALELAVVQVPAGASATNSVGVTITQTFPYTASSMGTILFRNQTEQDAYAPVVGVQAHRIDTEEIYQRRAAGWKVISRPDIDWTQLARSTGWTDVTGHTASICRRNGMVVIEGAVTKGAGGALSSILTVPSWARPSTGTQFIGASVTNSGANVSEIYVQSDGIMGINGYTTIAGGASAIVVPVSTSYTPR